MEETIKLYKEFLSGNQVAFDGNGDGAEWHKSVNKVNPLKFT